MEMDKLRILAIILVGGKRMELMPLVKERAKAALPIFGEYRIIDFCLSNLINSDIRRINIMAQYKYHSLMRHIREGWSILSPSLGEFIEIFPPQQREGERWYVGTADAIYQNLIYLEQDPLDLVMVLHGDHIYQMDYRDMIQFHLDNRSDCTMATIPKPLSEAINFGNMQFNESHEITRFVEKPQHALPASEDAMFSWINAGVYIFNPTVLMEEIHTDADQETEHNLSKNIIPSMIGRRQMLAYEARDSKGNPIPWSYFLSLDEYYSVNMALLKAEGTPVDLYNPTWAYRTYFKQATPSRLESPTTTVGKNMVIASGAYIEGWVERSIIGCNVVIEKGATVLDSIIHEGTIVKAGAVVEKAILDKHCRVESGARIAPDQKHTDIVQTDSGISIAAKETVIHG